MMDNDFILSIKGIDKLYPGVHALDNIVFDIKRNTIHCIIGENGSGKSTFIKILTGVVNKTKGDIILNDKPFDPKSVKDAKNHGIVAIYQELNVVNDLTVEENLTLGREKHKFGMIQKDDSLDKMLSILKELDKTVKLNMMVGELSTAQKQIIEIVKAVSIDCKVLVMDEPTASLSEEETSKIFEVVKKLKENGMTVIYISHKLSEVFEIGDFVTVLRDGKIIATKTVQEINKECKGDTSDACLELVKMMLGRVVIESYIPSKTDYSEKFLEVRNLNTDLLKNVSFDLFKGEILGFYGLMGAGKSEVARVLFGIDVYSGDIFIKGKIAKYKRVRDALKNGIAMIPEERREDGIFGKLSIKDNIPMMKIKSILKNGIISRPKENKIADDYIKMLSIAARDREQKAAFLSGGNQQKVVISKCLNRESDVLLMDEPTRGIDVGAKLEIHDITRNLANQGKGVIVFSSELPEILHLCDRIVFMNNGRVSAIVKNGKNIDNDQIIKIIAEGE
ncbi:MAG: sugar ABC transporter ATP-binding protein [Spirochaetia bacterium]